MNVVFTLCSANYLAHAKTLGDSLKEQHPDFHFVIGLVDRLPAGLAPSFWQPHELIPAEDIGIAAFADMVQRYDVVEMNTAVKPFYIEFLYRRDPGVNVVIYLDPDILVCSSLAALVEKLETFNLIVTPHSCTYDDSPLNFYYEQGMLTTGVYNLGFLATARSETTIAFLKWWQKRLQDHCYYNPGSGLFVDQLWVTLAPLYFDGVFVEKDPGYNMCYWNHFERRLSRSNGRYVVNGSHALVFYHFSSYSPDRPELVTKREKSKPVSFADRPELRPIYDDYRARLIAAGYAQVSPLRYSLRLNPPQAKLTRKQALKRSVRKVICALPSALQNPLQRLAQFIVNTLK